MKKLAYTIVCIGVAANGVVRAAESPGIPIERIEPTPLFPKPAEGQPLKQLARLHVDNPGEPVAAVARVTVGAGTSDTQDLGVVAKGKSAINILIPSADIPGDGYVRICELKVLLPDGSEENPVELFAGEKP